MRLALAASHTRVTPRSSPPATRAPSARTRTACRAGAVPPRVERGDPAPGRRVPQRAASWSVAVITRAPSGESRAHSTCSGRPGGEARAHRARVRVPQAAAPSTPAVRIVSPSVAKLRALQLGGLVHGEQLAPGGDVPDARGAVVARGDDARAVGRERGAVDRVGRTRVARSPAPAARRDEEVVRALASPRSAAAGGSGARAARVEIDDRAAALLLVLIAALGAQRLGGRWPRLLRLRGRALAVGARFRTSSAITPAASTANAPAVEQRAAAAARARRRPSWRRANALLDGGERAGRARAPQAVLGERVAAPQEAASAGRARPTAAPRRAADRAGARPRRPRGASATRRGHASSSASWMISTRSSPPSPSDDDEQARGDQLLDDRRARAAAAEHLVELARATAPRACPRR